MSRLGQKLNIPADLFVFGGSALLLLGGPRDTADLDYTIRCEAIEQCRQTIAEVAAEAGLDAEESIPSEFMPLPPGADSRHELLAQFGLLRVYMLDPTASPLTATEIGLWLAGR